MSAHADGARPEPVRRGCADLGSADLGNADLGSADPGNADLGSADLGSLRLRQRVPIGTFLGWARLLPGIGLPGEFLAAEAMPERAPAGARVPAVPVPPLVAASLAVHGCAEVSITVRVNAGRRLLLACLSVAGDLVAGLARGEAGQGDGRADLPRVELSLAPAERAVDEVLRWVPPTPGPELGLAGAVPSVQLLVAVADDAVGRWLEHWVASGPESWCRLVPTGPAVPGCATRLDPCSRPELARSLRLVLAECRSSLITALTQADSSSRAETSMAPAESSRVASSSDRAGGPVARGTGG